MGEGCYAAVGFDGVQGEPTDKLCRVTKDDASFPLFPLFVILTGPGLRVGHNDADPYGGLQLFRGRVLLYY